MSLLFGANTTDKDDRGSGSSIDDLLSGTMTVLARIYRTSTGNNQFIVSKYNSSKGWYIQLDDGSGVGEVAAAVKQSTDAFRLTNTASDAANGCPVNTWKDIGFTYDSADSVRIRIYLANLGELPVESSAYDAISGNGSGAPQADAANSLWIGNIQGVPTNPFKGRIELVGVFPGKLTPAQMQAWFANPGPAFSCKLAAIEGENGTGTQPDYSGNGNSGTVTGATVADNPPVRRRWGRTVLAPSMVASAGTSLTPGGFDLALALGTPTLGLSLAAVGLNLALAFGAPTPALSLAPAGLDLGLSFGAPTTTVQVAPAGLDLGLAFGASTVTASAPAPGLDLVLSFGTATPAITVAPSGLDLQLAFGTVSLATGSAIAAPGLDVTLAFGTPATGVAIAPAGFDAALSFGTPGLTGSLAPVGLDLALTFGVATVSGTAQLSIDVAGFDCAIAFGTATLAVATTAGGLDLALAFGVATIPATHLPVAVLRSRSPFTAEPISTAPYAIAARSGARFSVDSLGQSPFTVHIRSDSPRPSESP